MAIDRNKLLEEAKRRLVGDFTIEDSCFSEQIAFIQDLAKRKVAVTSRRSGKTSACARDLLNTALSQQGDVLYITLSRVTAKRIIWKELLTLNKKYKLNAKVDSTELSLTLPNGNTIYVSGAKDEAEIEKFRGLALRKIYIDEAQSFRSYIKELIDDVLEPCLTDYDGTLVLIGTPGPVPAGVFWECWDNPEWSRHSWTIHNNPFIKQKSGKDPEIIIEEICKRRGVPKSDPSIQREFYGQWEEDKDSLVFKFNSKINTCTELPDAKDLEFIFGVDIGYNDSDAIAVLGYSKTQKIVYLYEEFVKSKQTITELVTQLERLIAKYNPVKMVMDAGALGKKIQAQIQQQHSINLAAADKSRKFEHIELLNDDLRTGKIKALPGSRFEEDCFLVQWDKQTKDKLKISDNYHSDINDAVLYAWRECRHHFSEVEKVIPHYNDPGFMDYYEQKLMDEFEAKKYENDIFPTQAEMDELVSDE